MTKQPDKLFGLPVGDPRVKRGLIAVLVAVLVGVLLTGDYQGTPSTPASPSAVSQRPESVQQTAEKDDHPAPAARRARRIMPVLSDDELEAMLERNPFALTDALRDRLAIHQAAVAPEPAAVAAAAAREAERLAAAKRLKKLQSQKATAVLRSSDGTAAALIGEQLYREGDIVDGVKIRSITSEGVLIEPADKPE